MKRVARWHILLFVAVLALPSSAAEPTPMIVAGNSFLCVADGVRGNSVWCHSYKANDPIENVPSSVRSIESLAAGAWHACAVFKPLSDGPSQLACWGDDRFSQTKFPAIENQEEPARVAAIPLATCALLKSRTTSRISCWGPSSPKALNVPAELTHPQNLVAVENHFCASQKDSSSSQIFCWGESLNGTWSASALGLSPDDIPWCEASASQPKCHAHRPYRRETAGNVQVSSKRLGVTCSLGGNDASLLDCSGSIASRQVTLPAPGYDLAVTLSEACALHASGASCLSFADGTLHELPTRGLFWRYQLSVREPRDLVAILQILDGYSYTFDKNFFQQAQLQMAAATDFQQRLALHVLFPLFEAFPYPGVRSERMTDLSASVIRLEGGSEAFKHPLDSRDKAFLMRLLASLLNTSRAVLLRVPASAGQVSQVELAETSVALIGECIAKDVTLSPKQIQDLRDFFLSLAPNAYVAPRVPVLLRILDSLSN